MAKKKARGDFNMAAEVRNVLRENRKLSGPEVYAALKEKFPNQKINENSLSVAFSAARKKLGIKGGRRRKGRAKRTVRKKVPSTPRLNMDALQAAAKFVSAVGDADKAVAAIKQVTALQIK